jgi:hypothetical protein
MIDAHGQTMIITTNPWAAAIERFTSRKFLITLFVQAIGAWGFMKGRMDGGTYVALSTLVLSSYSAASIIDKKQNGPS